jgi:hypothetical protein
VENASLVFSSPISLALAHSNVLSRALEKAIEEKDELQKLVHSFQGAGLRPESLSREPSTSFELGASPLTDKTYISPGGSAGSQTSIFDLDGIYIDAQVVYDLFQQFVFHSRD